MSWWVLGILGSVVVVGLVYDTWRYNRNTERVLELLTQRGPMTGLELAEAGITRAHIYLILARQVRRGVLVQFPAPSPKYEGQFKYMVK